MTRACTLALCLSLIELANGQAPRSLFETPEWRAYQAIIAGEPSYQVHFLTKALGVFRPERGSLYVSGHKSFVLETDISKAFWDGHTATTFDLLSRSRSKSAKKPSISPFDFFGVAVPPEAPGGDGSGFTLSRLERKPVGRDGPTEIGWSLGSIGGDYGFTYEFWFDPKTKLLSRVEESGEGSGAPFVCIHQLMWDLKPVPSSFFIPMLPADETSDAIRERIELIKRSGIEKGRGRIVMKVPKDAYGELAISLLRSKIASSGKNASLLGVLPPGRYAVFIERSFLFVPVYEGYDSVVKIEAITSSRNSVELTNDPENTFFPMSLRSKPIAIAPGTYYIMRDGKPRKIVVVAGKTTKV